MCVWRGWIFDAGYLWCTCSWRCLMRSAYSGAETAVVGVFGCFIVMSLDSLYSSIRKSQWYSEVCSPLPFSLALSFPLDVSFILPLFFYPAGPSIPQNPPFVPFHFNFSSASLCLLVSPLSASSTAAEQINELALTEPDTGRRHSKDMLYVTQQQGC